MSTQTKQLTPMQELIEQLLTHRDHLHKDFSGGLSVAISLAVKLLQEEKDMVIKAFNAYDEVDTEPKGIGGQVIKNKYSSGEQYYNETYKQQL